MFDAFPYDAWGPDVADFWAFGGANSTGTYIMTALGIILMFAALIGWVRQEARRMNEHGRASRRKACSRACTNNPPRRVSRSDHVANKQIEFPPEQTNDKRVAPFMLVLSVVCIVIVVAILLSGAKGSYIGPW